MSAPRYEQPKSNERSIRFDPELLEWFERTFPWRGSLPQFLNQVMSEYKDAWGEQIAPHVIASNVVRRLAPSRKDP